MQHSLSLVLVLLALPQFALAGFDVQMTEKSVAVVTADNRPVSNAVVNLSVEARHKGFGLCGERIPVPGVCWHPENLARATLFTDASGTTGIAAKRFQNTSADWTDLEISLMADTITVPQCRPRKNEKRYEIYAPSSCDRLLIYNPVLQADLTQAPRIVCRLQMTQSMLDQAVNNAIASCARR